MALPHSIAAQKGHLAVVQYLVVQYLVQHGADKEKSTNDGGTPLFIAAQNDQAMVVQYLMQQGADKNKVTDDDYTPLFSAAVKGHSTVVQYLVRQCWCNSSRCCYCHGPKCVGEVSP